MFESCFFPRTHRVCWSSTSLSTWSAPCTRRAARRGGVDEWMVAANKIRGWSLTRTGIEATKMVMKSTEKWGCDMLWLLLPELGCFDSEHLNMSNLWLYGSFFFWIWTNVASSSWQVGASAEKNVIWSTSWGSLISWFQKMPNFESFVLLRL